MQLQAMQGASLVGRDVIVAGNKLSIDATAAVGQGGFELAGAADAVKVEILAPSGAVMQTLNLGAESAGVHSFDWPSGAATSSERPDVPRHGDDRRRRDARDRADARPRRRDQHLRHDLQPRARQLGNGAVQRRQGLQLVRTKEHTPWASSKVFPASTPRARASR